MITVYHANETDFAHNGLFVLTPTECVVTEELNGMYELSLTHPVDSFGRWRALEAYNVIRAPTPRGQQLFRIYKIVKKLDGMIDVNARHVFYDGAANNLTAKAAGITPDAAVKLLYANLDYHSGVTTSSDIGGALDMEYIDVNPVFALLDEKDGLATKTGGEVLRDNFDIKLLQRLGADNGVWIRYRKNLTGLDFTLDASDVATRIKPKGLAANDTELLLPEVYINSELIDSYPMPLIRVIEYSDIRVGKDYNPQTAQTEMRRRVAELFAGGADKPTINAKVQFIQLGDTEEYKEYKALERIDLGDTVTIWHEGLGIGVKARCVRYAYDCLMRRYTKLEIGNVIENIARTISGVEAAYSAVERTAHSVAVKVAGLEERMTAWENEAKPPDTEE